MLDPGQTATNSEAVAVFSDRASLEAAIDDLLTHGFDHAELSVLASEGAIKAHLGHGYLSTSELEDDPDVPRTSYIPDESLGDAQGAIIGAAAYLPAIIGSLAVISSGGTLLGAVAVAAIAGGAGAVAGTGLARLVGKRHAEQIREHLAHGGLLLWVRTHDSDHEKKALDILRRHGGNDVRLHVLPPAKLKVSNVPVRRPLISFGAPD